MQCDFFDKQLCASCTHCKTPYAIQVVHKDNTLKTLFAHSMPVHWLPPVISEETGFRNKAKMTVLGAAHAPMLGIETPRHNQLIPVSLVDCSLYPQETRTLLIYLEEWIRKAGIQPYNKTKKTGELKFILLTRSEHNGDFLLRFVTRTHDAIARIENNLPRLLGDFPAVKVVSVNIQPIHMARLEGDEEIFLTTQQYIEEKLNDVPLVIRPKSFFQTNPKVAAQLYATAREWVRDIAPEKMWDLFCGVGGFALHCAEAATIVTGIEIEPEAIASARHSAQLLGIKNLDFAALDSEAFSAEQHDAPSLILVNPPRRGLGEALARNLATLAPQHIVYSSCNPQTLLADMAHMPNYKLLKLQWFDMFPHTDHAEVLVLLERTAK